MIRRTRKTRLEQLESRQMLSTIPVLHSFPGAEHTIYLDFDGHVTRDTNWNTELEVIHSPPFDIDGNRYDAHGNASFNEEEHRRMVSIWERMAEDFRPFNVDVTTVDPSVDDPGIFARVGEAQRVVFTTKLDDGVNGTGKAWFHRATRGIAAESWDQPIDNPVWVFSNHEFAGEIGTHEMGHAFGLEHDGAYEPDGTLTEYRGAHGSGETRWSPIMGQGNGLTQWSDGAYPQANNNENDIGVLARALGRRPDDHDQIVPLELSAGSFVGEGIIETVSDTDLFSMTLGQRAMVDVAILPWHNGPNLDIGVTLHSGQSVVFDESDSVINSPDKLSSHFQLELDAGTYFLIIDGVGRAPTADDPGYSDYGSLGYYRIEGVISMPDDTITGDVNSDGRLDSTDIDALFATVIQAPRKLSCDFNNDALIDSRDVETLVRDILQTEIGDFNLDQRVDFSDFLILSHQFGNHDAFWSDGDANGDRVVDFQDFLLLSSFFGF